MNSEEVSSIYWEMRRFCDLLLETMDDVLKQVLGEGSAKMIYNYLETIIGLRWTEISERPEIFSAELKKLLGSGASIIETLILRKMYLKLQLEFVKREGYEFSDYIMEMKKGFENEEA